MVGRNFTYSHILEALTKTGRTYYCCLASKSRPTLCDLMDCSSSGSSVLHYLLEFAQFMPMESVMLSKFLILCWLLLLLPSVLPSIRVFSNESALCVRWSKYWSFSTSPSSEYSGCISFRTDWLDLLTAQGRIRMIG